jgi:hypothetical protein
MRGLERVRARGRDEAGQHDAAELIERPGGRPRRRQRVLRGQAERGGRVAHRDRGADASPVDKPPVPLGIVPGDEEPRSRADGGHVLVARRRRRDARQRVARRAGRTP